jgi:hypothetical protein
VLRRPVESTLTPLVGVENLGFTILCNGLFKRLAVKVGGHSVRQSPGQDFINYRPVVKTVPAQLE